MSFTRFVKLHFRLIVPVLFWCRLPDSWTLAFSVSEIICDPVQRSYPQWILNVTDYMSDIYYLLENLFYSAPVFYAMATIFTLRSTLAPCYLLAIRLHKYHAWPKFFLLAKNRVIWPRFAAYDCGDAGKHKNIAPHYVAGTWNDRFGILQSFETKASGGQSEG